MKYVWVYRLRLALRSTKCLLVYDDMIVSPTKNIFTVFVLFPFVFSVYNRYRNIFRYRIYKNFSIFSPRRNDKPYSTSFPARNSALK